MRNTGSPRADAESDFLRARRRQVMAAIGARFVPGGEAAAMPLDFGEVVGALGYRGEQQLGELVIPLSRIVGSVDKTTEFDRGFRPTSGRSRQRWERIAEAIRRGEETPPIDVYKVGDLYFVRDGHHRVSVANALGLDLIDAFVTQVSTAISPTGVETSEDLDRKHWRRIFLERVPLTGSAREALDVANPDNYHRLAEMVEAWAARRMHAEHTYLDKETAAARWHAEEFLPVLEMIENVGLTRPGETPADAYLRVACERYELTREHTWDLDVLESLKRRR